MSDVRRPISDAEMPEPRPLEAVRWSPDQRAVRIIDQRKLPNDFVERDLTTLTEVREAIHTLAVRGAPAIGICGAMGLVVSAAHHAHEPRAAFLAHTREFARDIAATRPTAVNLPWAVGRVLSHAERTAGSVDDILEAMREEATAILEEDRAMCLRIGEAGAELLPERARVLTHCNAGALATGGLGTALAPVYVAASQGRSVTVLATETRPLLQGSRLTAWELSRAGIPVTVITDSAAASRMRAGDVDLCIVGADRVTTNGDAANKIGTYLKALAAKDNGVPFYVAFPHSTVDWTLQSGADIPIEERGADEVLVVRGRMQDGTVVPVEIAAPGSPARNDAFDVTPARLITGLITERGVAAASQEGLLTLYPERASEAQ